MRHPIEHIVWLDSFSGGGWKELEKVKDNVSLECGSIGYVVDETDKYVIIAPHYHNDDFGDIESINGEMAIPKCSIII